MKGRIHRTLFGFALLYLGTIACSAQTPATNSPALSPTFDVTSVKPSKSPGPMDIRAGMHGSFSAKNASLLQIMNWAYGVKPFQIAGGPGWVRTDRFDVEAKVVSDEDTTMPVLQARLRAFLADRFAMSTHEETREVPVYSLVLDKGGLKQQASAPCVAPDMSVPLPPRKAGAPLPCGTPFIGKGRLDGGMLTLDLILAILEDNVGRPVINRTGLTGRIDVHLTWSPDDIGFPGAGNDALPSSGDQEGPSLFTALQEQMGLRLRSDTGPAKVIVVDRVEHPDEN